MSPRKDAILVHTYKVSIEPEKEKNPQMSLGGK